MDASLFLARSAYPESEPQFYADHVVGVRNRALRYLKGIQPFVSRDDYQCLAARLLQVADKHDLGKLLEDNQRILRAGPRKRLAIPHENAGAWFFFRRRDPCSAALVYGHHLPGLPNISDQQALALPYCRTLEPAGKEEGSLLDAQVKYCLEAHKKALGPLQCENPPQALSGQKCDAVQMRILLSLLVNADWDDAAGRSLHSSTPPRWAERSSSLEAYARSLGPTHDKLGEAQADRNDLRSRLYEACLEAAGSDSQYLEDFDSADGRRGKLLSCEAPVGMGKTLAFLAYALKRAQFGAFRHVFVILPYTSILQQVERVLKDAILLDGESAQEVVGVIHHRAEYDNASLRDIAADWDTPIVLTTAVQFFESLASNAPARLKKLHHLPGSVIVLDEFDAALPPECLPVAWKWLSTLASEWGCDCVLSSGTLVRFWDNGLFKHIYEGCSPNGEVAKPDPLISPRLMKNMVDQDHARISFRQCRELLSDWSVLARIVTARPGPRIVVMDTRESAARAAAQLRDGGSDVLHLSNALAPRDCEIVLKNVEERLAQARKHIESEAADDWTLVSTTYAGIGLDLSFRTGFIRAFSCASILQLSGRISRNSEYPDASLWVFDFNDPHTPLNPSMKISSMVLHRMLSEGVAGRAFSACSPAELATHAFNQEFKLSSRVQQEPSHLLKKDRTLSFKEVAEGFNVIRDDEAWATIVDDDLALRIKTGAVCSRSEIQSACVSLRRREIESLGLGSIARGMDGLFHLPESKYDAGLLGYFKSLVTD